jgi:hypothetical protein
MESLMLVVMLGIVGTGASQALIAVAKVPTYTDATLTDETALVSRLEQMRSIQFDSVPIGGNVSPYSDSSIGVDVAYADPRGGASPSTKWKKITAHMANGKQLVMTVCKP